MRRIQRDGLRAAYETDKHHDVRRRIMAMTMLPVFRLDALALSVIATATWLAGWVAVCHSRYCIKTTKRI